MALRNVGPISFPGSTRTYLAETAVTRGYIVGAGATESGVAAVAVAGGRGIGIADESYAAGVGAAVIRLGDAIAIAGAAATKGQYAKADATGRAVPVTGTAGGGEEVIGRFESSPANPGDECVVFVHPFVL